MVHHFRQVLTPASRLRYLWWRASQSDRPITVALGDGGRIIMRPAPARDFGVAYDIFFRAMYGWPDDEPPQAMMSHVVDVGANVGYTIVDWARRFPGSRIEAFEPHPRHLSLIKAHVALNAIGDRVTLHESAAGSAPRDAFLVDAGPCSYVNGLPTADSPAALSVHVSDFFETVAPAPIDLLKLDAEGAEYSLLSDPRFGDLDVRALVLEWHHRADNRDGGEWCRDRLGRLGYRTAIRWRDAAEDGGLLWAFPKR
jgi:FkbM family methyltransferase